MSVSPPPLKRQRIVDENQQEQKEYDLCIYSWNINGIEALLQRPISQFFGARNSDPAITSKDSHGLKQLSPLQVVLARHNWPHLYFLQEVKIRPGDEACMRAVRKAVVGTDKAHSYTAYFCLPNRKRRTRGTSHKIYGVCTLIRDDFASTYVERTEEVQWDQEGRFLVTYVNENNGRPKLAIFNVYMVNGTSLPYLDHTSGKVLGTRHDRKLEVHALLHQECRRLQAEGYAVIIAGDINVARSELDGYPKLRTSPAQHIVNRSDFEQRFLSTSRDVSCGNDAGDADEHPLGMVDTFRKLHPERRGYSYYTRNVPFGASCDRVDMILVSRSLKDCCVAASMHETEEDRGPSDHIPIFAKFDFTSTG